VRYVLTANDACAGRVRAGRCFAATYAMSSSVQSLKRISNDQAIRSADSSYFAIPKAHRNENESPRVDVNGDIIRSGGIVNESSAAIAEAIEIVGFTKR
jgi:hypothetical protein